MAAILKDIKIRASIEDDTKRGSGEVSRSLDGLKKRTAEVQRTSLRTKTATGIKDLEAQTNASILRQNGEFYDAERVLRERAFQREISDIKRHAEAKIAANKEVGVAATKLADVQMKAARRNYEDDHREIGERESKEKKEKFAAAHSAEMQRKKNELESYGELNKFEERRKNGGSGFVSEGEEGGGHGESGGGHGAFGRIFSDQKTTGLDPLGRGLMEGVQNKLGLGVGIGVLAVAGKALSDITEKASEFSDKLREGKVNAADMTLEIGKGVPVFGSWMSAGENINEILTGQKANLEAVSKTTESVVQLYEMWGSMARRVAQEQRDHAREMAHGQREIDTIGLRGSDAELASINNKYADSRDANQKAREEATTAAAESPEVKAAIAAKDQFNKAFGGMDMGKRFNGTKGDGAFAAIFEKLGLGVEKTESVGEVKAKLDAIVSKIQKKANEERDNKISYLNQDDAQKSKEQNKELTEANRLIKERREIDRTSFNADSRSAQGRAGAEEQQTAGDVVGARKTEIDVSAENAKEQAQIDAKQKTEATTNATERAEIAARLGQKLRDIERQKNADIAAADKDAGLDRGRALFDAGQAELDVQATANANRLKMTGRGLEGERILRRREIDRKEAEIDRNLNDGLARDGSNADAKRRTAAAEKGKLESDFQTDDSTRQTAMMIGQGAAVPDLVMSTRGNGRAAKQREDSSAAAQYQKYFESNAKAQAQTNTTLEAILKALDKTIVVQPMISAGRR